MPFSVVPVVDASPAPVGVDWSYAGTAMQDWQALRVSGLDENGNFHPNLGCFVLRGNGRTVLCDTGIGPGPNAYLSGLQGRLPEALAEAGVGLDEIDAVVFTHLHMDHIGWTTRLDEQGRRVATFPNATCYVERQEFEYWDGNPPEAREHHKEAFSTAFLPIVSLGRLVTVDAGVEIMPGVTLIATPGHTPHHCSIRFSGASGTIVVAGDVFHTPGQIERPDWCHRADMEPDRARESRKAFIAEAARDNWTIAAGHFRTGLQLGGIVADGEGFRFSPHTPDETRSAE